MRASRLAADDRPAGAVPVGVGRRRPVAVELVRGRFRPLAHDTGGTAAVVRLTGGRRVLTLTGFRTDAGPDLRVVVEGDGRRVDLGGLRGNRGDQQYALPAGAGRAGSDVVIWCRLFSVAFGAARLTPS